jgi:hypothetical protein
LNANISKHDQTGVLVLIPAWNEGIRIEPVVAAAAKHLPVLVVDDGSSDETAERAADAGAVMRSSPWTRMVSMTLMKSRSSSPRIKLVNMT